MPGNQTEAEAARLAAVARAEMMLSLLSQQAAAARAEAEYAELRLLLAEARVGDSQPLIRWLDVHRGHVVPPSQAPLLPATASPHSAPGSLSPPQTPSGDSIVSWEQLLPAARERLRRNSLNARAGQGGTGVGCQPISEIERESIESMKVETAEGKHDRPAVKATTRTQSRSRKAASVQPFQPGPPKAKQAADRAPRLTGKQVEHSGPSSSGKNRGGQRLRGMVASVAFHLVLVLFLAFFTLRMPVPPASLALEAIPSERATETVELSQSLEVESSESRVEVEATPPTVDAMQLATSLEATTSMLGGSLMDFAPAQSTPLLGATTASSAAAMSSMQLSATFFGAAAGGNCFCYVIDSSASMRNGPWEAAKSELLRSLASLKEKQRFYIIFFNRQLSPLPSPGEQHPAPYALYATQENLQHARQWIDSVRIEFGAPPNAALELAISKEPDAIYLLTDGDTQVDVAGFLRRQNRVDDLIFGEQVRVPIHAIAFYSLAGQELLKQIATENNGQFIYVPDPRQR